MKSALMLALAMVVILFGSGQNCGRVPVTTPPALPRNEPPTASIREVQPVRAGETVILDGSDSSDPDGDPLTYLWRQITGPSVSLSDAATQRASFVAPHDSDGAILTFQLTVSDGQESSSATVGVQMQVARGGRGEPRPEPLPANRPPAASVSTDQRALAGMDVVLDGTGSSDPDQDALTYTWQQLGGPSVTLNGGASAQATFRVPDAPAGTVLSFQLTVSDSRSSASASTSVEIASGALVKASWSQATEQVNVDVDWLTPAGDWLQVNRSDWKTTGTESIFVSSDVIAPGLHWLTLTTRTGGHSAQLDYAVFFLNYRYRHTGPIIQDAVRAIGLDVRDGEARVIFNGWLRDGESGSGGPSGFHLLDVQQAWREASAQVEGTLNVYTPAGDRLNAWSHGWAFQGLERATLPVGTQLADGTWLIEFLLNGSGNQAAVTCDVQIPGYSFHHSGIQQADDRRIVVLDMHDGMARPLFNGWLASSEQGAGDTTDQYPLEFMVGWRNANEQVNGDIHVYLPNGDLLEAWRHGWAFQGLERAHVPAGTALPNGTYRLVFDLHGEGRFCDVTVHTRLHDYRFTTTVPLLARATEEIQLHLQDGSVTVLSNTWTR